jgi:acyl carrier protein
MHDGELYVAGRLKDVIIVGGRNHYPQDIEATAVAVHSSLVPGGCAAFSVERERDGGEAVVVVAEMRAARSRIGVDVEDVAARVRSAIASEHGISVAEVVLVERKSLPKTSSGKVQRAACRAAFERGELSRGRTYTLHGHLRAQPSAAARRRALRRLLLDQIESVLSMPPGSVDPTAPFQELGLDSLMTAELRERLEVAMGERMSPSMFFAHPTTDQLPAQHPKTGPAAAEADTRWELARRLLNDTTLDTADRVAGALVVLYAQPVARIARLRRTDITHDDTEVRLRLGRERVLIPEPLAGLIRQLPARRQIGPSGAVPAASQWLFPGRQAGAPQHPEHVRRRLGNLGIDCRSQRNAALLQLAAEVPAAVLADTLGLHPSTAVRWTKAAGGDWTRYAAQRTHHTQTANATP